MPSDNENGFVRTGIACSYCQKESMWPVSRLLALETISCRFCGTEIDLRPRQIELRKIAHRYREVEALFDEMGSESSISQ